MNMCIDVGLPECSRSACVWDLLSRGMALTPMGEELKENMDVEER